MGDREVGGWGVGWGGWARDMYSNIILSMINVDLHDSTKRFFVALEASEFYKKLMGSLMEDDLEPIDYVKSSLTHSIGNSATSNALEKRWT